MHVVLHKLAGRPPHPIQDMNAVSLATLLVNLPWKLKPTYKTNLSGYISLYIQNDLSSI